MHRHLLLTTAFLAACIPVSEAQPETPATRTALAAAGIKDSTGLTISPDGNLAMSVVLTEAGLTYAAFAHGGQLLLSSPLGLAIGKDEAIPGKDWKIAGERRRTVDDVWEPLWGKRAVVPDHFVETVIEMNGPSPTTDKLHLVCRAYDDGLAFRYEIPAGATGKPRRARDLSGFHFSGDFTAWFYNGENHNLGPDKLSAIQGERLPVMTLQAGENNYLAIHEADLRSGTPMKLRKFGATSFAANATTGELKPGFVSPWRVILIGKCPGTLVDSHLIELLNPPAEGDFSWVKTGVCMWDWRTAGAVVDGFHYGMDYPSWLRMLDLAAEQGFRHLVLDANWYGPEFAQDSNPTKGDKAGDVKRLIAYAKPKDVGIWVYLNDVGGRRYPLAETLKQYADWGVAGVKYGFMEGSPEEKNARTRMITELCAENRLLCNFHDDPVHPYGQMRTWPNAVTREFCHAQLDARRVFTPKTFVTTVFVNMLAGPIDMNNGMFDLRQGKTTRVNVSKAVPSTLVSEAARTLIVFSGATILPDVPEFYRKYPDLLAFLSAQKQPWRESRTLSGKIGEHIVMARQAADGAWLVGAATSEEARELEIPLSFLGAGGHQATIIQDGGDAHYLTNRESVRTKQKSVSATDTIKVKLAPGGGACVLIHPLSAR
jgi:alpha-glucosidase